MNREAVSRLALSSIISVIGGITLMSVCGAPTRSMFWWLLYTVGCGIVLNTREGERPRLLLALSAIPAAIPALMAAFELYILRHGLCFTVPVDDSPRFLVLLLTVVILSWLAIFLFSFARNSSIQLAAWLSADTSEKKIARVEGSVRAVIALLATLSLLYAAIAAS